MQQSAFERVKAGEALSFHLVYKLRVTEGPEMAHYYKKRCEKPAPSDDLIHFT